MHVCACRHEHDLQVFVHAYIVRACVCMCALGSSMLRFECMRLVRVDCVIYVQSSALSCTSGHISSCRPSNLTSSLHVPLPIARGAVTSVEWSPYESSMLATSGADNSLAVWDLALEKDPEEEEALAPEGNAVPQVRIQWHLNGTACGCMRVVSCVCACTYAMLARRQACMLMCMSMCACTAISAALRLITYLRSQHANGFTASQSHRYAPPALAPMAAVSLFDFRSAGFSIPCCPVRILTMLSFSSWTPHCRRSCLLSFCSSMLVRQTSRSCTGMPRFLE